MLLSLLVFCVSTIYNIHSNKASHNQQGLAVVMVGTVLAVSCSMLCYQTASKYKAIRHVLEKIVRRGRATPQNTTQNTSQGLVEMAECVAANNELREPLLQST